MVKKGHFSCPLGSKAFCYALYIKDFRGASQKRSSSSNEGSIASKPYHRFYIRGEEERRRKDFPDVFWILLIAPTFSGF